MKMKLSMLAMLFALFGTGFQAVAAENEGIQQAEIDEIKAACKADARDAEDPAWYAKECVDDRIQAIKEERGLVKSKDES
ncbi:MAG: hypothetical protein OEZ33_09120 [Gammaproteobacteria bacterium]|nr:hypothetical protein [Gammaproteobacteria bacterium]MDH5778359.1 hypothetical protein [Gammaproteobacteria bacterium]